MVATLQCILAALGILLLLLLYLGITVVISSWQAKKGTVYVCIVCGRHIRIKTCGGTVTARCCSKIMEVKK